jgi:2-hydroxychromene-2-carboxylate isomerase
MGDHLKNAAIRSGLDLDELERAIEKPELHLEEIKENQKTLEQSGHWGVPTFVFNKESFFGQDRIDSLCWRLEKEGLSRSK